MSGYNFDNAMDELESLNMNINDFKKAVDVICKLRESYTPIIKMTQRAHDYIMSELQESVQTGRDNFLSNNGLGDWRFNSPDYYDEDTDEWKVSEFTAQHNFFYGLTRREVVLAYFHPERIKVVSDEEYTELKHLS